MKIISVERFSEESTMTVDIQKQIESNLSRVNCFLEYLQKHSIIYEIEFCKHFENQLKLRLPQTIHSSDFNFSNDKIPLLVKYESLVDAIKSFTLSKLLPDSKTNKSQQEINTKNNLSAFLHLQYYLGKSIELFQDKTSAILFFKSFIDYYTTNVRKPEAVDSLDEFAQPSLPPFKESFDMISFIPEEGKFGVYVKRCRWHETLSEFNDPEWAYAVACHFDFEAAKCMNPSFVLTRTTTCANGDKRCDFIWHDKRINTNTSHPAEDFWEKLDNKIK